MGHGKSLGSLDGPPIFVSARSARYFAIELWVCVCVRSCVKHSGRLIRAVRLRTGRKTKMAAFYRVKS